MQLGCARHGIAARPGALVPRAPPRGARAAARAAAKKKAAAAEEAEAFLTPFARSEITEILTDVEHVPEPLWSSWCGHTAGVWVGTAGAYCPTSGEAEPIALAEDGRTKLYAMQQCCVEDREAVGDADVMVRRLARATSPAQLAREMAAGDALQFDATASVDWEVEEIAAGQPGFFCFDGGSFSAGPLALVGPAAEGAAAGALLDSEPLAPQNPAADEMNASNREEGGDGDEAWWDDVEAAAAELDPESVEIFEEDGDPGAWEVPPQGTTTQIEHCLQWGGEQRVRVRLTLCTMPLPAEDASNGPKGSKSAPLELDVCLLRVSVAREDWEGAPGRYTAPALEEAVAADQERSAARRLRPADVAGFWNSFEVAARSVEDVDLRTGAPAVVPLYSSREVQRLVQRPEGGGFEEVGAGGARTEGGALWLPHSVGVQLTQGGEARGLEVATVWCPQEGVLLGMTRRYSEEGELLEVVTSTSVRAK